MKPARHTDATLALCRSKVDEANAIGRQDHGPLWAPDMLPCDAPCRLCLNEARAPNVNTCIVSVRAA